MKKTSLILTIILAIIVLIPLTAQAFNVKASDSVYVGKDEVVEGNMYIAAQNITIEGAVNGDLIAAAQNINVKGKVAGDIITASQNLNVEGEVGGNIRSIANTVTLINASISRNVNLMAATVLIAKDSTINWDAMVLAGIAEMRGTINGSLHGAVDRLVISGTVNEDVSFALNLKDDRNYEGGPVELTDSAQVGGNFNYSYKDDLNLNSSLISGAVNFEQKSLEDNWQKNVWNFILAIFSALVVGLVLISIFKKQMLGLQAKTSTKHGKSLLLGLGVLFLTPILAVIIMITVIGIPLALIILALWMIMIYLAQIFVGLALGKIIREKAFKRKKVNLMADLIVGTLALWILFAIPVLGGIIMFISTLLGFGSVWRYSRQEIAS